MKTKSIYAGDGFRLSDKINSFITLMSGKDNFRVISIQLGGILRDSDGCQIETALIIYDIDDPIVNTCACPYCRFTS
jgi:hypothetical protein